MKIELPEFCLVALIGASGSGKSTFAKTHFLPTEVLSSDYCRGLVSDDENSQSATNDAFDVLNYIAGKRLAGRRIVVVDATNVQKESRRGLLNLAREFDALPVAIVLNVPAATCQQRNRDRANRDFGRHVVRQQYAQLRRSMRGLKREGFRHVTVLGEDEIAEVSISRNRLWTDLRSEIGPFDVIGDVHGCFDELCDLLTTLGYAVDAEPESLLKYKVSHPEGRRIVFLGDLVDRGPKTPDVLKLAMSMVSEGTAYCVQGNHDAKLLSKLRGKKVKVAHGLQESLDQLESESEEFKREVMDFLYSLRSHYLLDDWKLVVAHAGMKESYQGRASGRVRSFALYGETTGETDEFGLPVRHNWASEYRGDAIVVYGHTPVPEPEWLNRTINIDTGCVFGGRLSALRYPEQEIVSAPARQLYCEPARPLDFPASGSISAQQEHDDLLHWEDVSGKRIISTKIRNNIVIREENTAAAAEAMSRFAVNPKWLVYLPPTMSPCETSQVDTYLEHPAEALDYFGSRGVAKAVCQEKHMGSRAIVVICRSEEAAREQFGVTGEGMGTCYTRIGRSFFNDKERERAFLERLGDALQASGFWDDFETDWVCLDCELMPWSFKAQTLLQHQYAAVGSSSRHALSAVSDVLEQAVARGVPVDDLATAYKAKEESSSRYRAAYRRYCWSVDTLDDLKLAPFHIMATEGRTYFDRDHEWHMRELSKVCEQDPKMLLATPFKVVDLTESASRSDAIDWWTNLTDAGGEGLVFKPYDFVARGKKGFVQPAIKCRGAEYLRIIYGPEYDSPANLTALRRRGLSTKRSLALREFALGVEGLERFVKRQPLRRVHECVFGVMALESEPVDPRL